MPSSHLLPLAAPAVLLAVACLALHEPGRRPRYLPALAEAAALLSLAITALAAILLVAKGPGDAALMVGGIGRSVRLDALSSIMLLLIAFIGWVVLRYARSYMDGEARQGAFTGWLCVILATVLLLVQSGNVWQIVFAWIATSLILQKLLLFYPERVQAQRAARKRQIITRLGDLALIGTAALLTSSAGTSDISAIAEIARAEQVPGGMMTAAGLLALAAVLMSAQFPTQGWLTEVMETPTPVSALLHAGIINAGGFLLIRFADVMLTVPGVLAVLVMIGGFSALLGGLVMLTQPAVKTSLAWSTVAQMGFMLLQCGLALFPLALLHIVAHSLYKAHAFLFSGEAVERVNSIRRPGPVAIPNVRAVAEAFGLALIIYTLVAALFGGEKSVQALALGAILIFGVAYLLAQGLADAAPRALTRLIAAYAITTTIGYFSLQIGAQWLMADTLPPTPVPGPLEWALIALVVASFGLVALAQALFPLWAHHPAVAGLRVHLANGLYANAWLDHILKGWAIAATRR